MSDAEKSLAGGIEHSVLRYFDRYRGSKSALIAAGLAKDGQFPGDKDCPRKVSASYNPDGSLCYKGQRTNDRDAEGAKTIQRFPSGLFLIRVCPSKEVWDERFAARMAQFERRERDCASQKDPGAIEALRRLQDSPARFNVGDRAVNHKGDAVTITGEYRLLQVCRSDGQYLRDDGQKVSYEFCYEAEGVDGVSYCYPAFQLREPAYPNPKVKHIRLAFSRSAPHESSRGL